MKKTVKLLSLLLSVLMLASALIACGGDAPAQTSDKPKDSTPTTTAAPVTTAADTSKAPETTTKPAETTTKAPETVIEPHEAALPADPNHTEHVWYSLPSFTAYDEAKADGTIGYMATHCRHEGCEAIKDDKVRPTLVNLTFDDYSGNLMDYLTEAPNVSPSLIDQNQSKGSVTNNLLMFSSNHTLFSTDFSWDYNKEYYVSMDIQTNATFPKSFATVLALGQGAPSIKELRYFFSLGLSSDDQSPVYMNNYSAVSKIPGLTFEMNSWYRLEYIAKFGSDTIIPDTVTDPTKTLYTTQGTVTMFLTPLSRNADGDMIATGERIMLGTFQNFALMGDDDGNRIDFTVNVIKIDHNKMIRAADNLIVSLAEQAK